MKKFGNPKIVCTCVGENHTCNILANAASNNPPQHQDAVENMALDTDSNSSVASNAGNETAHNVPLINEDSGIDSLLNVPVPTGTSGYSSANTTPDMDLLRVPSGSAFLGTDTTPDTDNDTSSGIASISTSSSVSDPHSISAKAGKSGDNSTATSPSVPPTTPTTTDTPPVSAASNPETTKDKDGGPSTSSQDDPANKSPSRPTSLSSGLRRTYSEFSKTDDAEDDSILKCITYVSSEDMVAKKKKTDEDADPKGKSTSSSGSKSRKTSSSRSVESRDTSIENLSGCSSDPTDENDWYTRMRTRGPKISITGSIRADGTIDETQEHRSSSEGGSLLPRPVGTIHEADEHKSAEGGNLLSVNPPPEGDICENIYFDRKSPSLAEDEEPPKQDEDPQPKKDDDEEEDKDNDGA